MLISVIFTTLTLFLPFKIVINEKAGYAIGACVNFVYEISALYLVISIIISLLLIKRNNFKKWRSRYYTWTWKKENRN